MGFKTIAAPWLCGIGLLMCGLGVPAYATEADAMASDWNYTATIYLWGAGIEGATSNGSTVDIGFSDLLDNLNFGFMATLEARKDDWSRLGDIVHLDVGTDKYGSIPFPGPGPGAVDVAADAKVKGWVLNFLGGYTVARTDQSVIDLIGGVRYLNLDVRLDATRAGIGGPQSRSDSSDYSSWDAVVGFRGRTEFGNKWFAIYHADIGTGESDSTWQLAGGGGYQFGWGDVTLAYRHMEWESGSAKAMDDIKFSGPLVSAGFHF